MNLSKSFIEILKQKLSVGSSRSVLLNAIPGKLISRLSITDLDTMKLGLSKSFIDNLTSDVCFNFKFSLDTSHKDEESLKSLARINKRISNIKYDYDDYSKEHGVETFGIGFPMLVHKNPKDSSKFIVAPLFIFSLHLEQSFNKSREWVISRKEEAEIRINEVLYSFLENEEHIKLPQIPEEMLEDGILDKIEIEKFCAEILSKFNNPSKLLPNWNKLETFPEKFEDSSKSFQTKIHWNGVFSLFKSPKQNLLKETELILSNFENLIGEEKNDFEWEQSHSPMITDPSQNGVLKSLINNKNIVIQGPPGTGKSQTLTAIITSALANKKKILVVCEKRTALEVLKNNLEKLIPETGKCIGLIEDVTRDRAATVQIVRSRTANYLTAQHQLQYALKEDIKKFESKANVIQNQYQALKQPIWRNQNWSKLVSKWINYRNTESDINNLYRYQKIFKQQKLTDEQYFSLVSKIEEAAIIFSKISNDYTSLDELLITPNAIEKINDQDIIFNLKDVLKELININEKIDKITQITTSKITSELKYQFENKSQEISILNNLLTTYSIKNIDLFKPSFAIKIKSLFLKKYKNVISDCHTAQDLYNSLNIFWQEYFNQPFDINKIIDNIENIKITVPGIISNRIDNFIKNETLDINTKHLNYDDWVIVVSDIKKTNEQLSHILKQVVTDTFKSNIEHQSHAVNLLSNKINNTLEKEISIKNFFVWKSLESTFNEIEAIWVKLLISENNKNWSKLVEDAWLYFKLLKEDEIGKFPIDDYNIGILKDLGLKIQKEQKELISSNLNEWFKEAQNKIKSQGIQINQLFNLRGSKGTTRNSLRRIVRTNISAFTDLFPVLMLNPSTCSTLLPLERDLFDLVIFDEASQLRIEDTFGALLRGQQIIVSGDSQQMPPSSYFESSTQILDEDDQEEEEDTDENIQSKLIDNNSKEMAQKESLLEFAIDMGFKETYLDMHYRSQHPDLIEFSNVCFYNSRLIPMPEKDSSPPITYIHVGGLYDKRKNIKEAEAVLEILKTEIDETKSVGVATFNLEQRNLILTTISDERALNADFARKMDVFDSNGFFVKNLENIQGDERDVLLISTTFGNKIDGKFIMNFGPITQQNGHRLLNVIITRAKNKVYVLTSIPESKIPEYRERLTVFRKVDGRTGLLAYLAYAKAVSTNNIEEKNAIVDFIRSKVSLGNNISTSSSLEYTESPFEEEVYNWLSEAIGSERIKLQYKCGGFRIDMVVFPKSPESNMLAIECDGAAYHSDELAWHYDMYRQEQLEKNGFTFHRIWSTNWWRKPNEEFEKLLDTINKIN